VYVKHTSGPEKAKVGVACDNIFSTVSTGVEGKVEVEEQDQDKEGKKPASHPKRKSHRTAITLAPIESVINLQVRYTRALGWE
jgi:hypothetical protein